VEVVVVPGILDVHELPEHLIPVDMLSLLQEQEHAVVGLRRSEAVDARDRGDDDHVVPLEERCRGCVAHPVDLFIN